MALAGIAVSPVVLEIDSPQKSIAVKVTNTGDHAVIFQTGTMVWKQINGTDENEPTDELMVVPAIVEVPARESQIFRVMLRNRSPSPVERTYRVILEDISEAAEAANDSTMVSFKLTHSLPVLIAPVGKVINAIHWQPCQSREGETVFSGQSEPKACVRLLNAGNRRVKIQSLTLIGEGWKQVLRLEIGFNMLAGAQRDWHVPLTPGQSGTVRSVEVQTASGETLLAEEGAF